MPNNKGEPMHGDQEVMDVDDGDQHAKPKSFILDLSLSTKNAIDHGSSSLSPVLTELNLLDKLDAAPETPASPAVVGAWKKRDYPCNYCHRRFHSSQALGGHQNAHKGEKTILRSKRSQLSAGGGYPYTGGIATIASLPLRGSAYRPFGIQAHSMLFQRSGVGFFAGSVRHGSWPSYSRAPLVAQQPAVTRFQAAAYPYRVETVSGEPIGGWWRAAAGGGMFKNSELEKGEEAHIDLSLKL